MNRSWKRRIAFALPAALLVSVAINQLYLAHVHQLNSWKGGGFGMFASADRLSDREAHVYLVTDDEQVPVDTRALSDLSRPLMRMRSFPTASSARQLTESLTRSQWRIRDPQANSPLATRAGPDAEDTIDFRAVRVLVVRLEFDPATHTVSRRPIAEHRVEVTR